MISNGCRSFHCVHLGCCSRHGWDAEALMILDAKFLMIRDGSLPGNIDRPRHERDGTFFYAIPDIGRGENTRSNPVSLAHLFYCIRCHENALHYFSSLAMLLYAVYRD